jgi:hypothetical protein
MSTLIAEPPFPPEIRAELLDTFLDPSTFCHKRWEIVKVVEGSEEGRQWNNSSQLMQDQERGDVRDGRGNEGRCEAMQKPRNYCAQSE